MERDADIQDLIKHGIVIPAPVIATVRDTLGSYFRELNGTDPLAAAMDHLDPDKHHAHATRLDQSLPLRGRRLLEIGSGYGIALALFTKVFEADAVGIEPDGEGFASSIATSRRLLQANGLDPGRVVAGVGEKLPFPDEYFDVVYSCNVLEHTRQPDLVLREAIRVLRTGGILHLEVPNHLSYFEGHYLVLQPPLLWRGLLPWWIKTVYRRDPAFARTLRTEINPAWCRRTLNRIRKDYPAELLSLGEERFLERFGAPVQFEMARVATRLGGIVRFLQKVNAGNWIGRLIVWCRGHYPIVMVVRKGAGPRPEP